VFGWTRAGCFRLLLPFGAAAGCSLLLAAAAAAKSSPEHSSRTRVLCFNVSFLVIPAMLLYPNFTCNLTNSSPI